MRIDKPPWSRLNRKSNDRFRCPACGKAVAWAVHGPTWRPGYSDSKSGAAIPISACAALTRICMKRDAGHSVDRGGPTQWVCMWVCAGPNHSLLAWEMSSEWLTLYSQLGLGFTCPLGSSRRGYYPAIATR